LAAGGSYAEIPGQDSCNDRACRQDVVEVMSALSVILRPVPGGWAVYLSDGRELARFRGLAARWRALRFLARA
jgi:hypothetical protein